MKALMDLLENLQTEHLLAILQDLRLEELVKNPAFLGAVAVIGAVCLFKRWYGFLGIVFGLTGFVWLLSYTLQRGTELGGSGNPTLLVFIGGGVVIIGIVIYLLFIRSD
ncbi:hypothetical protein EDC39_11170 [Geothermobacter ehrlichii]|uniref:Uncharacterized protein n=1 Tax=Geothermobacter ehrlichii TaxID=213224 RepID=A0A5D3WHV4_9BACT|nr:hypothetical protein [Geothermobacter ehrlichii]TYO97140.1 hypothetical protein EDC39_11170 [Geothermobacter ehrlichii]